MGSKTLFRLLSSMGAGASSGRGAAGDLQQSKHTGPAAGRIGIFGVPARSDLHPNEERDRALSAKRRNRTIPLESRLRILCLMIFAPGFLLALFLFWRAKTPWPVIAATLGFLVVLFLILMGMLAEQVVRPLQTMTNVVASLREGDFSFRARGSQDADAWGELASEVNHLADMLQGQQLSELEATALLRNVVLAMDAPVLAFDRANNLRLINPAAERLLDLTAEGALGRNASDLHLAQFLRQPGQDEADRDKADQGIIAIGGKGDAGRWMVRRSTFRQRGVPHTLLILSDVSEALRKQERQAWQRLIRVLGHEINNSLTPIKSIAGTLRARVKGQETAGGPEFDRALAIIESRADSLNRFVQAYRQLAQTPQPVMRKVSLRPLLERVAALETRVPVQLEPGPDLLLEMDPDQVEQLMINLIRNAAEAALARSSESQPAYALPEVQPEVRLSWRANGAFVEILITDNGTGLSNPSNLFVPFYTTKAGGSGVGLTLARQICEAHGGAIELTNRLDAPGCQAHVRLRL